MIIFVYGWYNHENLGDESYKVSFTEIWPEHKFIFSDKVVDEDVNSDYDLCILGGGDVIRDKSLKHISRLKCPKISISVTITSLSLVEDIHILDHIYVRDMNSYSNLINYGYSSVTYMPDISIILQGDKERGKEIIKEIFEKNKTQKYEKVYSIVVNAHLLGSQSSSAKENNMFFKMAYDMVEVIDKTDASFLFIPFATSLPWDDRVSNGLANSLSKFHKKNCVIYDKLTIQDSLDIISGSDLIITSRFHGLIFGVGNNIPVITISFHDKMSGFCETLNKPYINYWNFSSFEFERGISEIEKETTGLEIEKIKQQYREKVYFIW